LNGTEVAKKKRKRDKNGVAAVATLFILVTFGETCAEIFWQNL